MTQDETRFEATLDGLAALQARPAEVAHVLERLDGRAAARRRRGTLAGLAVAAIAAVAVAPTGRAAVSGVIDDFADFFAGSGDAPGTTVSIPWLEGAEPGSVRLLAEAGREQLTAYRAADGTACVAYGRHVIECDIDSGWRQRVDSGDVVPLTTTASDTGTTAVFGLTGSQVTSVRVNLRDGSSIEQPARFGFVVLVDGGSRPTTIQALDARGAVVATASVADLQWTFGRNPAP